MRQCESISFAPASSMDLGDVIHERMFAVELREDGTVELRDQSILGNMTRAPAPASAACNRARAGASWLG